VPLVADRASERIEAREVRKPLRHWRKGDCAAHAVSRMLASRSGAAWRPRRVIFNEETMRTLHQHPRLGTIREATLRAFVRERPAHFKVPSRLELRDARPRATTERIAKHLRRGGS
jgi:hypothetical protein